MPFSLPLPASCEGWRIKIFDNERTEEPHATIIWRRQRWRFGLRSGAFLDRRPDPREVPWEIVHALHQGADQLIAAWNALHPINPV